MAHPPAPSRTSSCRLHQQSPFANHERTVPVVLITPHGVEHLNFTDGDRALLTMKRGRLVLTVGDAE